LILKSSNYEILINGEIFSGVYLMHGYRLSEFDLWHFGLNCLAASKNKYCYQIYIINTLRGPGFIIQNIVPKTPGANSEAN